MAECCSYCGRQGHWRPDCPEIARLISTGSRFPKRRSLYTLRLRSVPIRARTRKLRAHWTCEVNQNLVAMYSLRSEDQLIEAVENIYMRQIKVDKAKLLEIVRKNREEHGGTFEEAQKTYREVVIKALDEQLKAAREGQPFQLRVLVSLEAPQNHTADYDRAIQMLEMSVDDQIIVSEQEFQQYVQDIWGWSRDWAISNMNYVNKNSRYYDKVSSLSNSGE
jgi:hypothetical protein